MSRREKPEGAEWSTDRIVEILLALLVVGSLALPAIEHKLFAKAGSMFDRTLERVKSGEKKQ